jgi:hypothetical protein
MEGTGQSAIDLENGSIFFSIHQKGTSIFPTPGINGFAMISEVEKAFRPDMQFALVILHGVLAVT